MMLMMFLYYYTHPYPRCLYVCIQANVVTLPNLNGQRTTCLHLSHSPPACSCYDVCRFSQPGSCECRYRPLSLSSLRN
ncbi:hypothetical protein B0F90DRAFT_1696273 [Multifurca ochricompacta]|uniref:Uncharacterized protein n=1 Tax=Multifurca ochricompacta TaxID=376703 RepID=A0AAD4QNS0_9AGAM|nr:hypothetical protein B0F90DRAFT_1696273 [Multifurca ochricompacta]